MISIPLESYKMIRLLTVATLIATCIGCQQASTNSTQARDQETDDATIADGNNVPANTMTRSMIGKWGKDGVVGLIVTETNDRVVLSTPASGDWRIEISDVKIVGDTIHFIRKHYLQTGEDHAFNDVACFSIAKMVDDDTLELGLTTEDAPEYDADMLKRIE